MITALIPSNQVAQWLLVHIHRLLDAIGLEKDKTIEDIIYAAIIVCFALFLGWAVRKVILLSVRRFVMIRHSDLWSYSHCCLSHLHGIRHCSP